MTKAEVNRALAEAFEPKPPVLRGFPIQQTECWIIAMDEAGNVLRKDPRDFTREPHLTVMMLEWCQKEGREFSYDLGAAGDWAFCIAPPKTGYIHSARSNDFKLAVAEATAKARGIWID